MTRLRSWIGVVLVLCSGATGHGAQAFVGTAQVELLTVSRRWLDRLTVPLDTENLFSLSVARWRSLADSTSDDIVIEVVRFEVRPSMLRMNLLNPEGVPELFLLFDANHRTGVLVDLVDRVYVDIPPGPMLDSLFPASRWGGLAAAFDASFTLGDTAVIRGTSARALRVVTPDFFGKAWLAPATADDTWWRFFATLRSLAGDSTALVETHPALGPLRIQMLNADGYAVLELLSIVAQRPADSLFVVPAGYTQIDFTALDAPEVSDTLRR